MNTKNPQNQQSNFYFWNEEWNINNNLNLNKMPEFDIVSDFDITIDEFLEACSPEEIMELISKMKSKGYLK